MAHSYQAAIEVACESPDVEFSLKGVDAVYNTCLKEYSTGMNTEKRHMFSNLPLVRLLTRLTWLGSHYKDSIIMRSGYLASLNGIVAGVSRSI